MRLALLCVSVFFFCTQLKAQTGMPYIEPGPCKVMADSSLVTRCGYLVVPENRQNPNGRKIKLAFMFVRKPDADPHKNVTLMCTGGPGYSTLNNFRNIRANAGFLKYGGFILLDQRGTRNSIPCLDCAEVDPAVQRAYREQLNP